MNKRPCFLFYTGDWLKDPGVRQLSPREKGVYIEILILMFDSGGYIQMSEKNLMHALNFRLEIEEEESEETMRSVDVFHNVLERLIECGVIRRTEDGRIFNKRMLHDLSDDISQKRSEAGKRGAAAKWQNDGKTMAKDGKPIANANNLPMAKDGISITSSISSSTSELKEKINKKENPGVIPSSEKEAVDLCMGSPVPEWFIREKAYPTAIAEGFKTASGNLIASWAQWVTNYWNNWQNSQYRQKQGKKQSSLYDDKPLKEIKI